MKNKIFGIDLGTTNSCLSVLDGVPRVIPIEGNGIVPSVVSADGSEILVGRKALNRYLAYPEESVRSVKRLMGSDREIVLSGRNYRPEDISALILKYLCQEAKNLENLEVERVVITVPAYFSEAQRKATILAGEKAGLKVERIINEPTAAALFYDLIKDGARDHGWRHALAYDLGGGTFDVSVLRMEAIIEVLASTGDTRLGGDDLDALIAGFFLEHIKEAHNVDLTDYRPALARLTSIAEKAKIILSARGTTKIEEAAIPGPKGRTYSLALNFNRPQLEALAMPLVDRSLECVNRALSESGLKARDIDRVLLVGGMTRMPVISEKLGVLFGKSQLPVVDPDLSVAHGAAIQGGLITGEQAEQVLVDVTAHTLSLEALVNQMELRCIPIIPRNTPIPSTRSHIFSTNMPNQEMGLLCVYQGESEYPEKNELISQTPFFLNKVSSRTPIEVEFSYDINGMIHLVAEQIGYRRKMEIDIDSRSPDRPSGSGLSKGLSFLKKDGRTLTAKLKGFLKGNSEDSDDGIPEEEWDEEAQEPENQEIGLNFTIKRAKNLLESLENQEDLAKLSDLLDKYTKALHEDSGDIDDVEDELLIFMENIQ
ncbi:MAG: Hsp70 family protein [Deltaproteobacteria bacterium]|jgi:molecular chaperone DnaK|nr:Hsp70 family protein [Deltaproteobacteria bacterium]